jgi:hypothetical protein
VHQAELDLGAWEQGGKGFGKPLAR